MSKVSGAPPFLLLELTFIVFLLDLHSSLREVTQERNEFRAHGRRALEVVFFGYEDLLRKLARGVSPAGVERWVMREQEHLREELLRFPRVDQFGRLLTDSEEEDEEEKEAGAEAEGGSRKSKEAARDQ